MPKKEFIEGIIGDSIFINASAQKVWDIISDLPSISERNDQCQKMFYLSKDKTLRPGLRTLNVNKRGPFFWATTAKILVSDEPKELSFKINENGTVWTYFIEPEGVGVWLTESRDSNQRQALVAKLADKTLVVFGGKAAFDEEMKTGIRNTLATIKHLSESV